MGRAVAAALGATTRRTGYLEGASDLVTWCVGHLVELDAPEAYNPAWKQWRLADLPLCPAPFAQFIAVCSGDKSVVGISQITSRVS
jgi:DNA topoisomerase III